MSLSPDLAGFTDAQRRHRENFGEAVTFFGEATETYPAGTPLDPETGRPYDPTIDPDSSTAPQAVVNCNVVYKAVNRAGISGEAQATALGWMETGDVMLIADITDKPQIDGKVRFQLRDETWDIHSTIEDGIAGVQRLLVFGRKR